MSKEIAKKEVEKVSEWSKYGWDKQDLALIHQAIAPNTSPSELKLFLHTANKYGLDPLLKEVQCVKYGNSPATIFAGVVGLRAIAQRSGMLDGMEVKLILKDGKEVFVTEDDSEILGAIARIWRKDMSHPIIVSVSMDEYYKGKYEKDGTIKKRYDKYKKQWVEMKDTNWDIMPETMIKKVAESQGYRIAFSISGLYGNAEDWHNDTKEIEDNGDIKKTADSLLGEEIKQDGGEE